VTHPLSRPTRTLAALLTTTVAGAGLAACSSAASDAGRPDGVLDVVGQFEVHSLDPATAGGVFTRLGAVETLVDAALPEAVTIP
jgi:peptide/nickel transport system substrate-binding protein